MHLVYFPNKLSWIKNNCALTPGSSNWIQSISICTLFTHLNQCTRKLKQFTPPIQPCDPAMHSVYFRSCCEEKKQSSSPIPFNCLFIRKSNLWSPYDRSTFRCNNFTAVPHSWVATPSISFCLLYSIPNQWAGVEVLSKLYTKRRQSSRSRCIDCQFSDTHCFVWLLSDSESECITFRCILRRSEVAANSNKNRTAATC